MQAEWQVGGRISLHDFERAVRRLVATPDRRTGGREAFDGIADLVCATTRKRGRALTVDLGEGGVSVLCAVEPELGELVRLDVGGLVVEGRVRHVAREGALCRIGVEAA
jgi:hypothetical protein